MPGEQRLELCEPGIGSRARTPSDRDGRGTVRRRLRIESESPRQAAPPYRPSRLAQRPAGGIRRGPHHLMLVTGDRALLLLLDASL
jgi:hypothetical protein